MRERRLYINSIFSIPIRKSGLVKGIFFRFHNLWFIFILFELNNFQKFLGKKTSIQFQESDFIIYYCSGPGNRTFIDVGPIIDF